MADVQAGAHGIREQHVARDDRLLGDRGPARQSELRAERALVHLGVLGQAGVLRVLGDDAVEGRDVLEGAPHEQRVMHALAVVAEDAHRGTGVRHGADLGEPLAREPHGDGADRAHRGVTVLRTERGDLLDDARGIGHRGGVGHGVHSREAAGSGRAGSREHRLARLEARLAQVGVQVDEAGQRHEAVGVDHGRAVAAEGCAAFGHDAALDEEVGRGAVGQPGAPDENRRHAATSRGSVPESTR
ncbi:hypothetical protein GCM10025869_30350 [Homoserinibacter gongjuensis]|uniref:Uncharacterized protein n=1 Tax=Homoserinibacter gongjuensis TaxID=1162968 RepID=A0ABQ6JYC2_9MICO|nr:hypothetical protein GCM10025869_30350 [Homoserinibacter gongjuensis]